MQTIEETIKLILNDLAAEGLELEFKEASGGLPKSLWETVSAFANTNGGIIILGIAEKNGKFELSGITNASKLESDFWNTIRNPKKISMFSIGSRAFKIHTTETGEQIISIEIPQATLNEIPVHLDGDLRRSYIRKGEGDFLVSEEELKALMRNATPNSLDRTPIKDLSIDDLDSVAISKFKTRVTEKNPNQGYGEMTNSEFLYHMGMITKTEEGTLCPYNGTLLMFGKYNAIKQYYHHYHLDYFDFRGDENQYIDRVSTDDLGSGEMNILNFFDLVHTKLIATGQTRFLLNEEKVRINTSTSDALREALVNAIAHADYAIPYGSIRIEVYDTYYKFINPGKMVIPVEKFFAGGDSCIKNDIIMSTFIRMGYAERQGYGGWRIFKTAKDNKFRIPQINTSLEKTTLTIWNVDFPSSYPNLTEEERNILSHIVHSGITSKKELRAAFPNYTDYAISKALADLTERKIIESTGAGRSTKYVIPITSAKGIGQIRALIDSLKKVQNR